MKLQFISVIFLMYSFNNSFAQDTCQIFAPQREIVDSKADSNSPYNFVCHVTTNRKTIGIIGTAYGSTFTFISPRVLIGANHAIKQSLSSIKSIDLDVYSHEENGKPVVLRSLHFKNDEYKLVKPISDNGPSNDFGLIILNKPITGLPANFPILTPFSSAKTISASFRLSGYPKTKDIPEFNGERLWERDIAFDNVTNENDLAHYPCIKAAEGDSGGPLWFTKDGQIYLIGTHVGGRKHDYNDIWGESFNDFKISLIKKVMVNNQ